MDGITKMWLREKYQLIETDPCSVAPSGVFSGIHGWRACAALILAYCNNPEHVDWSDVQSALEEALKAFELPTDFPERMHEIKKEDEERARQKEAQQASVFARFPREEWQRIVAEGGTEESYSEWIVSSVRRAGGV
jgi:hypothetical protein